VIHPANGRDVGVLFESPRMWEEPCQPVDQDRCRAGRIRADPTDLQGHCPPGSDERFPHGVFHAFQVAERVMAGAVLDRVAIEALGPAATKPHRPSLNSAVHDADGDGP